MCKNRHSLTSNTVSKKQNLKTRRRLSFSENESSPESEPCSDKNIRTNAAKDSLDLTPHRTTPLSERQQIALLCRLSAGNSSEEASPVSFKDDSDLSPLLKRNERGETPLHLAAIKGDLHKVRKLLREGARVNAIDFAGWTPLHEACNYGWYDIVKLLIQFGADVNAPGLDSDTPLHDAVVNKHEKIVKFLLKYGADPLQKNAHRRTPLDVARSEEIIRLLKEAAQLQKQKNLSGPGSQKGLLRTPEAVGNRQSEKSPCHPISALCDLTMRKNSPQNQTHKGADKPTSPRLTLRFQSIRSRDDKNSSSAKVNDISSSQPKYQSYCVTMETKGDVYDFRKEDATVSSTQNLASIPENEGTGTKSEAVTSTCKEVEESSKDSKKLDESEVSEKSAPSEKMDTSENVVSKVNGGRLSSDSCSKECASDLEKEDSRRKRRKSSDSVQSRHNVGRGHKSPCKSQQEGHGDQRSPKTRKRGSLSSSDTESNQSDAEAPLNDANVESSSNFNGPTAVGPHSPKVPPLKIVIPSGTGSLELETRERSKVSSSKQALPYVVNTTTSDTVDTNSESVCGPFSGEGSREGSKSEIASSKSKEDVHQPEERFQRVTRSSQRMQAAMSGGSSSQCHSSETHSNLVSSSNQKGDASGESSNDEQMQIQVDVHPRKRKLRAREATNENGSQNPSSASSSSEDSQQQHQLLNSYQMYLNIRKQVGAHLCVIIIGNNMKAVLWLSYVLMAMNYISTWSFFDKC
ncbi:ankyrin repeat domain-containing protein 12-like [Stegodyphus dumicola]|uniref:ankyrin repeat domain-containing protein 12-like n=1 Tax=Stegodyphus dumicola TaxID=202533 RepID=UPI0015A8FF40|nr:ankyrin repeat domain-containing protein 12-like [Stegodyphus dumicola]